MSQHKSNELTESIAYILAILMVIVLIEYSILFFMSGGGSTDHLVDKTEATEARIKPEVTLADIRGDNAPAATDSADSEATAAKSPEDLYNGACMACHAAGVAGAPKTDDKAAWETRFANGLDALVASVKNGKGAMPPKGGSAYSDAEITLAVEYILEKNGIGEAKPAAEAPAKMEEKAAEPAAMEVKTEEAAKPAASSDVDLAAGEKAYGAACVACHASGVAGAPKLGDAAGWAGRADLGLDAMTANAINGKGAMPPKGGAAYLSDAEMKNIVAFMMSKI